MPGLSGLETLDRIKDADPDVPVVMITKSEEENIMDQAVGSKIADYLIKPVNPNQILSSIKKNLHSDRLVSEKAATDYRQDFSRIASMINSAASMDDWMELYRVLVQWEMQLSATDSSMDELLAMQRTEADSTFCKYICRNYESWITGPKPEGRPMFSPEVFKSRVFPLLDAGEKVFFHPHRQLPPSTKWSPSSRCWPTTSHSRKTSTAPYSQPRHNMRATPSSQA